MRNSRKIFKNPRICQSKIIGDKIRGELAVEKRQTGFSLSSSAEQDVDRIFERNAPKLSHYVHYHQQFLLLFLNNIIYFLYINLSYFQNQPACPPIFSYFPRSSKLESCLDHLDPPPVELLQVLPKKSCFKIGNETETVSIF